MQEIRLKRLTLFLFESIIMQGGRRIDEDFALQFNDFIYECYEDNKELLSIIFDIDLLKKFIEGRYEILSSTQILQLLYRYRGFNGYINLLDAVGKDVDSKLIKLATMFTNYYQEILKLYYADSSIYYPKGYPKILS